MPSFTLIGERLNTNREEFQRAVSERDGEAVCKEALRQQQRGATHLDFNTGANKEKECDEMLWLLEIVLPVIGPEIGVVIDTHSLECLGRALQRVGARAGIILNAVTGQTEQRAEMLELALRYKTGVIAILTAPGGAPRSADERLNAAAQLHRVLGEAGIPEERQYFDPQILPLAFDQAQPGAILETVREMRRQWPGVHILAGLSNVSFNLPKRRLLNRTYLAMLLASGVDSVLCDPCDIALRETLSASRALLGQDDFLTTYLSEQG